MEAITLMNSLYSEKENRISMLLRMELQMHMRMPKASHA